MTTNNSTITHKPACEIEVGTVVDYFGLGIVVEITGEEDYTRFEIEYADGTTETALFHDEDLVDVARLPIEAVDAIIDAHNTTCPEGNPDACPQCDALWSARADANI